MASLCGIQTPPWLIFKVIHKNTKTLCYHGLKEVTLLVIAPHEGRKRIEWMTKALLGVCIIYMSDHYISANSTVMKFTIKKNYKSL